MTLATPKVMSGIGRGGVKAEAEWHNGERERHAEEERGASSPRQGRAPQSERVQGGQTPKKCQAPRPVFDGQ